MLCDELQDSQSKNLEQPIGSLDEGHNDDMHMDEIVPGLWLGDKHSATCSEALRSRSIDSVLSAMRGRIKLGADVEHYQVEIDDSDSEDVLSQFPRCIAFLERELYAGRHVLVHCQAGMSRSVTIVTAYLMTSLCLPPESALEFIRSRRPYRKSSPNSGFLEQLHVFYEARYKVTSNDKTTRLFYLERTREELLNGDGILDDANFEMLSSFPNALPASSNTLLAISASNDPSNGRRRKIRCKVCRQELATREHMLDHGQVGPDTPATTPATSRRPSLAMTRLSSPASSPVVSRRPSATVSSNALLKASISNGLSSRRSSSTWTKDTQISNSRLLRSTKSTSGSQSNSPISIPAASNATKTRSKTFLVIEPEGEIQRRAPTSSGHSALQFLGRSTSSNLSNSSMTNSESFTRLPVAEMLDKPIVDRMILRSASETNSRPALLRSTISGGSKDEKLSTASDADTSALDTDSDSSLDGDILPLRKKGLYRKVKNAPPLIINNSCSGYFVEPMAWMVPNLSSSSSGAGVLAGKIICPNRKCGSKLGNYDWAGVQCGCKSWVVPGFCIHKSKVDEID